MSQRDALLDLERRKLALLRQKLAEQERRVETLQAMDDDPFDALLERELGVHPVEVPKQPELARPVASKSSELVQTPAPVVSLEPTKLQFNWGAQPRIPRRVPPTWTSLIRFIGLDGKSYDQVKAFIEANKLPITPGAARAQLMNYRKEFGFIENPRKGFYKATVRALEFLEVQGEGAVVGSDGAFFTPTPPLTRAAA